MEDGPGLERLPGMFRTFATTTAARAPLYSRLSTGIAADPAVLALLLAAPPTQRQPVLLFACVHDLLLRGPDHELARWYPNLGGAQIEGDPGPVFARFCAEHRSQLEQLLATRTTQTNEIGRCALLVPALGLLEAEVGPLAHLDVGTSAGLNLLLDHYAYRYDPGGDVGRPSKVRLECGTRGEPPIPDALPAVVARLGLDRAPVDLRDDDATRWLEACVWPDQPDRFARLGAAITMARDADLDVRRGDAVGDTAGLVDELADRAHPVVTNTWVLSYLSAAERAAYLSSLDAVGGRRDLSWIWVESPRLVPELPVPDSQAPTDRTVMTLVRWRDGRRRVDHLATAHPHGYWLHWHRDVPR